MPYTKAHKRKTRQHILHNARELFSKHGYDRISIDYLMQHCGLTRGAFYAHFKNKQALYREALGYSAKHSALAQQKPEGLTGQEWLTQLLDGYLSLEHMQGKAPCPLAFMATDTARADKSARQTYEKAYQNMATAISFYAENKAPTKTDLHALVVMLVGTMTVCRSIEEPSLIQEILGAARAQARSLLKGI